MNALKLDCQLREETRGELRDLVKRLGVTAVYVNAANQGRRSVAAVRFAIGGDVCRTDSQIGITARELYENRPRTARRCGFLGRRTIYFLGDASQRLRAEAGEFRHCRVRTRFISLVKSQ